MPFVAADLPPFLPSLDFFPTLLLAQGESEGGDSILCERGRSDGAFLFLLADVAGHGAPAAAVVARLRGHLNDPICHDLTPGELLTKLNEILLPVFALTGRFVAAIAVRVYASGDASASNSGQPDPWLGAPGGAWSPLPLPGGPPLGCFDGIIYPEADFALPPGQQLLAFTDGVTEAGRSRGMFQHGSLGAFLAGLPSGLPVGQAVVRLLHAIQIHAGAAWPEDDLTVCGLSMG